MTFKLIESASNRWQKLRKPHHMAEVIRGVNFKNGVAVVTDNGTVKEDIEEIQKCAA